MTEYLELVLEERDASDLRDTRRQKIHILYYFLLHDDVFWLQGK